MLSRLKAAYWRSDLFLTNHMAFNLQLLTDHVNLSTNWIADNFQTRTCKTDWYRLDAKVKTKLPNKTTNKNLKREKRIYRNKTLNKNWNNSVGQVQWISFYQELVENNKIVWNCVNSWTPRSGNIPTVVCSKLNWTSACWTLAKNHKKDFF